VVGVDGKHYDRRQTAINRRKGEKIVLQAAGDARLIQVKNYDREKGNRSQHAPERTGRGRNYDPLQHDLYPVAGFYNDAQKTQPNGTVMYGRFGQWRPYTMICLRGIQHFTAMGDTWIVTDPPQTDPIQYATPEEEASARKHVVTESGTSGHVGGLIGTQDAWEREMGLAV
jgi:hypothetical protein